MYKDIVERLLQFLPPLLEDKKMCVEAADEIERLRAALEKIRDATPANEHKKWPHHHFYLVVARKALKQSEKE